MTGLVLRRELAGRDTDAVGRASPVDGWGAYSASGHRAGPDSAPVVIVEFADFQCPYCRDLAARLDTIRDEFPREVAVIFRHHPIRSHPHALAAARASECAAEQGRFWPLHDALYREQPRIGVAPWSEFAVAAGVPDTARFQDCVTSDAPNPALRLDTVASRQLGVTSTPTLLINETRIDGAPPLDSLRAYVSRAAARASKR